MAIPSFVDQVTLHVYGGNGGHGVASVHREKFKPLGGPDGGNGGDGGSVILRVEPGLTTLVDYHRQSHRKATSGQPGRGDHNNGANGEDIVLGVPDGTVISDADTGELLADLTGEGAELVVARGGRVILVDDFSETDLPHIVDACDVLVLPSIEESFGIVFLEGWMCGKPVIGARIPSTECVIEEGVDGLIAEPLDAPDLACCILALLRDPRQRERMGAAGRAKTLANHTWDAVTDRWEAAMMAAAKQVARRED